MNLSISPCIKCCLSCFWAPFDCNHPQYINTCLWNILLVSPPVFNGCIHKWIHFLTTGLLNLPNMATTCTNSLYITEKALMSWKHSKHVSWSLSISIKIFSSDESVIKTVFSFTWLFVLFAANISASKLKKTIIVFNNHEYVFEQNNCDVPLSCSLTFKGVHSTLFIL